MVNPVPARRYQTFRMMLTEARISQGVLQVEVAERLKKPQSFVSKYERGERHLDFSEFLKVAQAINIDPAEFMNE